VLDYVLKEYSEIPIIIISGHGTIDMAVDMVKQGAYDFITKPFDLNRLLVTIKNALERNKIVVQNKQLKQRINNKYQIIGESEAIKKLKETIIKIAPTQARVLIIGENGTGKELVARAIHEQSLVSKNAFIEVNCAAIPSELIESELFGHEKGSFTSAIRQKKGSFELANGGTLFLDEIGDMSLSAQAKVLRALQENKITRVGGEKDIEINVRIIAATNKNIQEEIRNKNFREDLYHRLSVIVIRVPSLRERLEDIPLLVDHFVREICSYSGLKRAEFTQSAIELLKSLEWSGNVRELRNAVERLMILCGDKITEDDINRYVKMV